MVDTMAAGSGGDVIGLYNFCRSRISLTVYIS